MKRNSDIAKRYPGYYNHYVLGERRKDLGLSLRGVAAKVGMNGHTVRRVFKGTATQKQVWPIARFFRLDWAMLHDLTLSPTEFHRAVLNGGSRSGR